MKRSERPRRGRVDYQFYTEEEKRRRKYDSHRRVIY